MPSIINENLAPERSAFESGSEEEKVSSSDCVRNALNKNEADTFNEIREAIPEVMVVGSDNPASLVILEEVGTSLADLASKVNEYKNESLESLPSPKSLLP